MRTLLISAAFQPSFQKNVPTKPETLNVVFYLVKLSFLARGIVLVAVKPSVVTCDLLPRATMVIIRHQEHVIDISEMASGAHNVWIYLLSS